jgi:chromosome partitioning protein
MARLVINDLEPRTSLARDVLEILSGFGIGLTQTRMHHRTAYRQSAAFGGTVHQLRSRAAQAIAEIEALATEILELLEVAGRHGS